jgi:hypothetical protein
MSDLGGEFDSTIIVNTKFETLPPAEYEMMVVESEMKDTKANDGSKYLSCKCAVVSGPLKGKTAFANFNWVNKSAQSVQIGKGQFADLCKAVNVPKPRDSQQVHNIPFIAKVDVDGDYNKFKSFKPRAVGGVAVPPSQPAAPPPPVQAGSAPWGK